MALTPGTKLGHYEIVAPIGKGGMGEVYRARDTKLGREVAIKVLPDDLVADQERVARFEREARLLASLSHPNIASIHGIEESGGVKALVLELIEGPTLAEYLEQGASIHAVGPHPHGGRSGDSAPARRLRALPMNEALDIAKQIAEALEAGHEAGIIHRDLKPANVKLKDAATVKVLDYGLAKAFADDEASIAEAELSQSPTLTRQGTQVGVILGTAAYMSPEQAKGKRVDKRTDIFAFGAVLYEMITGKKAFPGDDVSEVLAAVIKLEPDWSRVPSRVRPVIERCLQKDVRKRYRDIGDVRFDLGSLPAEAERPPAHRSSFSPAVAAAVVAFGLGLAVSMTRSSPQTLPVVRSQLLPPEGEQFDGLSTELSPAGDQLVFTDYRARERRRLWIRRLDEREAVPLDDTEGADMPFWSPDGRSIGFFAQNALRVVSTTGGAPRTVAPAPNARGGTWSESDVILFAADPGGIIYRVDGSGGSAEPVTTPGDEGIHRNPHFVRESHHFLFFVGAPFEVWLGDVETGETRKLLDDAYDAKFVSPGWLTYLTPGSGGALFVQRFDVKTLALVGEPISVSANLQVSGPQGAAYTFSQSNLLAYQPSGEGFSRVWMDRTGQTVETGPDPGTVPGWTFRISPSGRRLAVGGLGILVGELDRSVFQRLPTKVDRYVGQLHPAWSPDESRIAYRTNVAIRIAAVDGSSDEMLIEWTASMIRGFDDLDWSPDEEHLLVNGTDESGEHERLWLVSVEDRVTVPWLSGEANFTEGRFSPDGKWVAYRSDETGVSEVYIRPFPGPGRPVRVSTSGGGTPEWRGDGHELFYLTLEGALVAVDVSYGETLTASPPKELIPLVSRSPFGNSTDYDVTPDGERFLVRQDERHPLELVQGWMNVLPE